MRSDSAGMIGLPVRLAVCFLILGLMVPVVLDGTEDAREEISLKELREQASVLEDAMQRAYSSGQMVSVRLDVPVGQSLAVGGGDGDAYTIRLISDGNVEDTLLTTNPTVPVTGGETRISGNATVVIDGRSGYGVGVTVR